MVIRRIMMIKRMMRMITKTILMMKIMMIVLR